jgi:DNA-directed RNA polymerase specialized sigma24 family protein
MAQRRALRFAEDMASGVDDARGMAIIGGCMQVDILDLADKAARCVLRGGPFYTVEDWQDAAQEAAAAIYAAGDRTEGYLFLVAKSAICDWLRSWLRHPRGGALLDYLDYPDDSAPARLIDPVLFDTLARMLEMQRAAKVHEDVRYLQLRTRGYSTDGIAMEMCLSRRNVYAIRERLLPRLERIARGEIPPSRGELISAGKRKARAAC